MRFALFCLALGALPAAGQVEPIAIYTQFQHEPAAAVFAALKEEAESIMSPVGLRFEWRSLHDAGQAGATADLAVVTFMGSCVGMGFAEPFRDGALGWTHMTDGAILPFVDVDCDHIRGFLQGQFLRLGLNDGEEVIGRAIGRVLAHELYHVFAGTTHHSAEGVDQPRYSVRDLVDDRFRIGQEEFHILRTGNAPASPEKGIASRRSRIARGGTLHICRERMQRLSRRTGRRYPSWAGAAPGRQSIQLGDARR